MIIDKIVTLERTSLFERDFVASSVLKSLREKKKLEKKLGISLRDYTDIESIAKYLEVPKNNIYICLRSLYDTYVYLDLPIGLMVSLYDGDIKTAEKMKLAGKIKLQGDYLKTSLNDNAYGRYFLLVESRIRLMMLFRLFDQIPDSQKRDVFKQVYTSCDYGFSEIDADLVKKVIPYAKPSEAEIEPIIGKDGFVTVYRGQGDKSTPYNKAYSWTTNICLALFFATRFHSKSIKIYQAKVLPAGIAMFFPERGENEAIIFPDKLKYIKALPYYSADYINSNFGEQIDVFAQEKNDIAPSLFTVPSSIHGCLHTKRVFFLVLLLSKMEGLDAYQTELIKAAAKYHDIGRNNDSVDPTHGEKSFQRLSSLGIHPDSTLTDDETLRFIIENHCIDDDQIRERLSSYTLKDKKVALRLLSIFKDGDNLDRVRLNDLDIGFLRTETARRLIVLAYQLLFELKD